jgi:autotransporter-associated beta strand protein
MKAGELTRSVPHIVKNTARRRFAVHYSVGHRGTGHGTLTMQGNQMGDRSEFAGGATTRARRRRSPAASARKRRHTPRPWLDTLEDRVTPAVLTWTGAVDTLWSTAGNWDANAAPQAADDLVFPSGATTLAAHNDLSGLSLGSVTIRANSYLLWGNAVTLTGESPLTADFSSGDVDYDIPTTFASSGDVRVASGANLRTHTEIAGPVDLTLQGLEASPESAGRLLLLGSGPSTYTGATVVNAGVLYLGRPSGSAIPGGLTIGNGTASAAVVLGNHDQIPDDAVATIRPSGELHVLGMTETIGGLDMTGGLVRLGNGLLTLNGDVTTHASTETATIEGPGTLDLGGSTRTFTVADGLADPDLSISAVITGNGSVGLIKSGGGRLELTAANTYLGATDIKAGRLTVLNSAGLGTADSGTSVRDGASLILGASVALPAGESLALAGAGANNQGALLAGSGSSVVAGTVELIGEASIGVAGASTLTITGTLDQIEGISALRKVGPGVLHLNGLNQYHDGTTVAEGVLLITEAQAMGFGPVSVEPGATLEIAGGMNGDITVANPITIAGLGVSDAGALRILNSSITLTGGLTSSILDTSLHVATGSTVLNINAVGLSIPTTANLSLTGSGTTNLNADAGAGGGAGVLNVSDGRLNINADYSAVWANGWGWAIGGTGTIYALSGHSIIWPGLDDPEQVDTLHVIDWFSLSANAALRLRLGGTTPGTHDQIALSGSMLFSGGRLELALLPTYTPTPGDVLTIIDILSDAQLYDTFQDLPEGAVIDVGTTHFRISYAGGDGNDVTLTCFERTTTSLAGSPSPSTYGEAVTLTATITPARGGMPTGHVDFYLGVPIGGTWLGSAIVHPLTGVAKLTNVTGLPVGVDQTVTAVYAGSIAFASSTGATLHTVDQATTSTAIATSHPGPGSIFGQTITFTATVTPGSGPTPTGIVEFHDISSGAPGVRLGEAPLDGLGVATFSTSGLVYGVRTIAASYLGDTTFLGSEDSLDQVVSRATPTIAMSTTPVGSSVHGQEVTIRVILTSEFGGPITGTVEFLNGTTTLGHGSVVGDGTPQNPYNAWWTLNDLPVGELSLTAVYLGDGNNNSVPLAVPVPFAVDQAATTTAVLSSPSPSRFGEAVIFTAIVSANAPSEFTPNGAVIFTIDGVHQAPLMLDPSGMATLTLSSLGVGTHTVSAAYLGTTEFLGSVSGFADHEVLRATTATTLAALPTSPQYGQAVAMTATVAVTAGAGVPTGQVQFLYSTDNIDFIPLGTGTLGATSPYTATYTTTATQLPAGTFILAASYLGTSDIAGSSGGIPVYEVAKAATATTITGVDPASGTASYPAPVTFTVNVTATSPGAPGMVPDGSLVEILDVGHGMTVVGTGVTVNGVATITASTLPIGTSSYAARFTATDNFGGSTSEPLSYEILRAAANTILMGAPNPSIFGMPVLLTATVTAGVGTPTGLVSFFDGATPLGTTDLVAGTASLTVPGDVLGAGTHAITARYLGDGDFAPGTSPVHVQIVQPAASRTALAVAPTSSTFGQLVTMTATVSPDLPAGPLQPVINRPPVGPTGRVAFHAGATMLGTGALIDGVATFSTAAIATGVHAIRAEYLGGDNYLASVSTSTTQQVNRATPQVAIAAGQNPTGLDQTAVVVATVTTSLPTQPTGSVAFLKDGVVMGQAPIDPATRQAVFRTATLPVGASMIQAVYAGDANFIAIATGGMSQTVVTVAGAPTNAFSIDVVDGHGTFFSNNNLPSFAGTAPAGYTVRVLATPMGGGSPIELGTTIVEAGGTWSQRTSAVLPDGLYNLTAQTVDNTTATRVVTNGSMGLMRIDTVAPVVSGITVNPRTGELFVSYQDSSGLLQASLTNASFYSMARMGPGAARGLEITGVTTRRPATAAEPQTVGVQFNRGAMLASGRYQFSVVPWIADRAGNQLSGRFTGTLPTSPANRGTPFAALFDINGGRVNGPMPVSSSIQPTRGGRVPGGPIVMSGRVGRI